MFDFDIKRITAHITTNSEKVMILLCAMECLSNNPDTKISQLKDKLLKSDYLSTNSINISEMSRSGIEHYYYCAKMYLRLFYALINEERGYVYWDDKSYFILINSGIMLCDKAYEILRIRYDEDFLVIMKKASEFISSASSNKKSKVTSFLDSNLEKMPSDKFLPPKNTTHDRVRDIIAIKYLHNLGCEFVTREAILEKPDTVTGRPGLRLDVYGWRNDSTIIGIEVKNRLSDFDDTLTNERFGRYLEYCNEFYILCTREDIFKAAKRWCNKHKDAAALYYDGNESYNLKTSTMHHSTRRTTEKMISKAQEILIAKMRKQIAETYMDPTLNTPVLAVEKIKDSLTKNISFNVY